MSTCPECATELGPNIVYCPQCGHRVDPNADVPAASPAPNSAAADAPPAAAPTPQEQFSPGRLDEPEQELWEGTFCARGMVTEWIAIGVLAVLAVVLAFFAGFGMTAWWITIGLIVAAVVISWVRLFLRQVNVKYRLTTQRFVHQVGILRRTTDRIEVIDMDDITFQQGLVDRMFGVGTITITSSDETHPHLYIRGIENVQEVSDLIDNARRNERMRRGLHIEAV